MKIAITTKYIIAVLISIVAFGAQAAPSCGGHLCTPHELDCMENPDLCF